jgi:biopolymer transport protein ExbB/TolQ
MLPKLSAVELISYAIMFCLICRAIEHRIAAFFAAKRLRPFQKQLDDVLKNLRRGDSSTAGLAIARQAGAKFGFTPVFYTLQRYRNLAFIEQRVDEVIHAQFGSLYDRCEHSELAGPRWGLLFTALGIMLTLVTASNDAGALVKIDFNHIALAMINTALGISIANVERSTLAFHVMPAADKIRATAIAILIEANFTDERLHKSEEARNAA